MVSNTDGFFCLFMTLKLYKLFSTIYIKIHPQKYDTHITKTKHAVNLLWSHPKQNTNVCTVICVGFPA